MAASVCCPMRLNALWREGFADVKGCKEVTCKDRLSEIFPLS